VHTFAEQIKRHQQTLRVQVTGDGEGLFHRFPGDEAQSHPPRQPKMGDQRSHPACFRQIQ
jgi:hypothetical protein